MKEYMCLLRFKKLSISMWSYLGITPGLLNPVNPNIVKLKSMRKNPSQNTSGPIFIAINERYKTKHNTT